MTTTDLETGRYLAHLRDKAGLKQNELAQKVGWSPAVLSRAESGERSVSTDELNHILEEIGSEEAMNFKDTYGRIWKYVEKPQLGHPDESILWESEIALEKLHGLLEDPDIRNLFVRRIEAFREELDEAARRVRRTEHAIAFVGDIGVGKSTAICRVADLEIQDEKTGTPAPVLEVGGGGITICEVHIVRGPQFGLIVEPRSEEEIHREVREFAILLKNPPKPEEDDASVHNPDSYGTSREVERAIRNMSGLTASRVVEKGPDGNIIRRPDGRPRRVSKDSAMDLAVESSDADSFASEIITRMNLTNRSRRELWYPELSPQDPLQWVQEIFNQVNNGRHPEFSIPKRIEVMVPQHILGEQSLSIRLVDTKGIDRTAERGDIESHFNDQNTAMVLCSAFNSTPSTTAQQLLERAVKGQFANLQSKTAILSLPRPEEALAMKDDQGIPAGNVDEGYELKADQAEMRLRSLNMPDVRIEFFNAREDPPERLREFLMHVVQNIRNAHSNRLREVIDGANDLLQNVERELEKEIHQQVSKRFNIWIRDRGQLETTEFSRLENSLISAVDISHPSSLRASVRRRGEWYNLDHRTQLGFGARQMVVNAVKSKQEGFEEIARNLLGDSDLEEAFGLIHQVVRILENRVDTLLQNSQRRGREVHILHMKPDTRFWDRCENQWGQGYRNRVSKIHKDWFGEKDYQEPVQEYIESEWKQILDHIASILDVDSKE